MSSKRNARTTIPLEHFLNGSCLGDAVLPVGGKGHPVIVVDNSRRHRAFRALSGRGVGSDKTAQARSFSNSGSSFCSSITSCSLGSTASLCTSRWESIPKSRNRNTAGKANQDNALRLPRRREQGVCLQIPSRTRTNDLKAAVTRTTSKSKCAQKQHARRVRSLKHKR